MGYEQVVICKKQRWDITKKEQTTNTYVHTNTHTYTQTHVQVSMVEWKEKVPNTQQV